MDGCVKFESYMVVSGNGDANKLQICNDYGKQFEKSGDAKFKQAQEYTENLPKSVDYIHFSAKKKKMDICWTFKSQQPKESFQPIAKNEFPWNNENSKRQEGAAVISVLALQRRRTRHLFVESDSDPIQMDWNKWGGGFAICSPASSSAGEQEEGDSACVCVKETVTDRSVLVKGQTISKI